MLNLRTAPQVKWAGKMANRGLDSDPWLGELFLFPTVLHARSSFSFDISSESLQKALLATLVSLLSSHLPRDITVADRGGYSDGRVAFRIGIGNGDGFDILDGREEQRILSRIENSGPFNILDVSFHLDYTIRDGKPHKVRSDQYLVRLVFQSGRVELLVHHLKGIRRIDSVELLRLLIEKLNLELSNMRFPIIALEMVDST